MSFTVMRYKDGKPAPIKMSIWDAFKGAPPPRPRPAKLKPCSCCKKIHSKNPPQQDVDSDKKEDGGVAASNDTTPDKSNAKNDDKPDHSDKEAETYTDEDDKKLTEMKTAGETWKNIQTALDKKSLSQLKAHWKTIEAASKTSTDDKKDPEDDAEKKKKEEAEKHAEIEKQKAEGQAKNQQQKQTPEVPEDSDKKSKTHEPEDTNLKVFATRYDRHKWTAAASKHFDLTGQRITAEMARKIAEGR